MTDAILIALILLPLLLTYFLKSSASLGFLALCSGYVLQSFAGSDIKNLFSKANVSVSGNVINALLIAVPPLVTLLLCRGPSSRGLASPKVLLNSLIALGVGATGVLMAAPLIGSISGKYLTDSSLWSPLEKAQTEIVGITAGLALIMIWLGHRKTHDKHHK